MLNFRHQLQWNTAFTIAQSGESPQDCYGKNTAVPHFLNRYIKHNGKGFTHVK